MHDLQELPRTRLLPIPQAAAAVGLRPAHLRQLIRRGEVPSVQVGPRRRIDERYLRSLLRQGLGQSERIVCATRKAY